MRSAVTENDVEGLSLELLQGALKSSGSDGVFSLCSLMSSPLSSFGIALRHLGAASIAERAKRSYNGISDNPHALPTDQNKLHDQEPRVTGKAPLADAPLRKSPADLAKSLRRTLPAPRVVMEI